MLCPSRVRPNNWMTGSCAGSVVFVLHGVDDDQVEQFEDGLLDTLLHTGGPAFPEEGANFLEPLFLGRGQFFRMQDLERGATRLVCDQSGGSGAAKSELVLGGCRDHQVARRLREILERFVGDHIGFVRCEEHGLAAVLQRPRETKEIIRCPAGHLRIQRGVPYRGVDLHLREPEAREPGGEDFLRRRLLQIGPPGDRKSTRLNSSHLVISYAVFCLKKKKKKIKVCCSDSPSDKIIDIT